jgi:hypothetical protein
MKLLLYVLLFGVPVWVQGRPTATLIVSHANIHTVDIFDMKPEAIGSVKVATTIVGGEIVYPGPSPQPERQP